MQPDRGIQAQQASQLFHNGRWEELEELYRNALKEDPADARSAFRLGNLLAMRERYDEALEFFETAWLHRWPGPIALNNRGVVLACLGEARPAFKALHDATKLEQGCRPAAYNLGILCEKLGSEGSLPEVILDLKLGKAGTRASDLTRTFFEQALDGKGSPGWAETGPLERPLFLWTEDLDSGFGFEQKREVVNLEEANSFFNEGVDLIDRGQYEEGISKILAAVDLNPDLKERSQEPIIRGQVGHVRTRFADMRQKWDRGEFDGAAQTFEEILQMGTTMASDRDFADEILAAAIRNLARQIRSHKPENGWENLQKMITAARQRAEGHEGAFAVAGEDEEDGDIEKTPEPDAASKADTAGRKPASPPSESPAAEYIRGVCRQAWDQQISYLLGQGDFEGAINLLDFPDIEWFAHQDLPRWKLRALTSKAEILRASGRDAAERRSWKEAVARWKEGRDAAVLAEDPRVVQSFDRLISELLTTAPDEVRGELWTLLTDRDDRRELERCAGARHPPCRQDPPCPAAGAHHPTSLAGRRRPDRPTVAAGREMAEAILKALPEEPRAREILRTAQERLFHQWTEEARDLLERGRIDEAAERCARVEGEDPDHPGAREVRLQIEILRRRGENGPSLFDQALFAYIEARDAGNPELALGPALEMKRLDPKNRHTQEALDWLPEAYIHDLRVQLESGGKPNELREKLKPLRAFIPNYPPARELDKALRKAAKGYGDKKREASYEKLEQAEEAINNDQPEEALRILSSIRDRELAEEVQERRQDALTLLQQQISELQANSSEENAKRAEALLKVYQRWDPVFAEAQREERARQQAAKSEEKGLNDQMKRLRDILGKKPKAPFKALRELDDAIQALDLEGSPIRTRRSHEIRELRERLFRNMTPMQRFFARVYNLYYAPALPKPAADEKEGKPS